MFTEKGTCCICGKAYSRYGNNPFPLHADDSDKRCCDKCDSLIVIPIRLIMVVLKDEISKATTDLDRIATCFDEVKTVVLKILEEHGNVKEAGLDLD